MKKKDSVEYKQYALESYYQSRKSPTEFSREMGIGCSTFSKWLSHFGLFVSILQINQFRSRFLSTS